MELRADLAVISKALEQVTEAIGSDIAQSEQQSIQQTEKTFKRPTTMSIRDYRRAGTASRLRPLSLQYDQYLNLKWGRYKILYNRPISAFGRASRISLSD